MKKKIKLTKWDTSETLETEEDIAHYLSVAFTKNDPEIIPTALQNVIKARYMTQLANKMNIDRKSLYIMLLGDESLDLVTFLKLLKALDLTMYIISCFDKVEKMQE